MTIKLVGSSSGSVSLQAPASTSGGANRVLTLPDINSTVDTTGRAGNILQILQTAKTDVSSTTSASFVAISGFSVNITPSSTSSKILITVDLKLGNNSGAGAYIKLLRDSTDIYVGDTATDRTPCLQQTYGGGDTGEGLYGMAKMGGTFLDSPNPTSQVTYAVHWMRMNSATLYTNRCGSETHTQYEGRGASSITVIEVAA